MLQIQHIRKEYRTGMLVQKALDDVSLNLRDNEFVAILGPSGSGKTTLLNVIGGLDRYDSGDLIINGISTKKYKDRDWDSYRNHTIGFVFQSYNLIPHQTVLANVELALTISGIGADERRKRSVEALEKVGLGDQLHKKPSQMSGGQMQRVAIARALVNDPDILLADEPTGALDSDTSVQVMDLLREVAKDKLVVMVTHNPELAEAYATRIVTLKDGKIRSDTNAYDVDEEALEQPEHRNMGKSSMSFLTALSLSFHNLWTKKARTLLTAFAGSIGIIGIALILALSNGVNDYIQSVEEETLSEYPLQIQSTGFDISSMMVANSSAVQERKDGAKKDDGKVKVIQMVTNMFSQMNSNDLESLKAYLESDESEIEKYTTAVEYSYGVTPQIYRQDEDSIRQVNPDQSFSALGLGSSSGSNSMMSTMMSTDVFYQMPANEQLYENQYDVKAGRWPENYQECVLVLTSDGSISDFMLYTMGLRDQMELDDMIRQFADEETIETPDDIGEYTYDDILGRTFKLVNSTDYYEYDSQYQVWKDKTDNDAYMKELVEQGDDLEIVGIVQPKEDANASALTPGIGYPASLVTHVAEEAAASEIVKQQLKEPGINVFTGEAFGEEGNGGFDMNSLFTVDESALQRAFGMNGASLENLNFSDSTNLEDVLLPNGENMDLSGMIDLSEVELDLSKMPELDLADLISDLDITVKPGGMKTLMETMTEGYADYVKVHPEADYSSLGQQFGEYLSTPEAKAIIQKYLSSTLQESGDVVLTTEQMQSLITRVMTGMQGYVQGKAEQSADYFGEYLQEYLQTAEAKAIMTAWANEVFGAVTLDISDADLTAMAKELAAGYSAYAKAHNYADPAQMGQHFVKYLKSEDGQKRLMEGLSAVIDMESLESQLAQAMNAYMKEVMGVYTEALTEVLQAQITSAMQQMMGQMAEGIQTAMTASMSQMGSSLQNALGGVMQINGDAFAEAFQFHMTEEDLTELMMSMSGTRNATYDGNLQKLGYVDQNVPTQISIYPKDFENKEKVVEILDQYNQRMEEEGKDEQVISYTDVVGTLMSSVTSIIDTISYVLIAFVAISLVVSSIMIGVITYISVLERKKEIGILRAIGASKRNISQVFNAETFIIGLCAGVIGIGMTLLLLIPGNFIIHSVAGNHDVNAVLPAVPAVILILLSVVLTLIGGLIPSKKAAKSDPVTALRTE